MRFILLLSLLFSLTRASAQTVSLTPLLAAPSFTVAGIPGQPAWGPEQAPDFTHTTPNAVSPAVRQANALIAVGGAAVAVGLILAIASKGGERNQDYGDNSSSKAAYGLAFAAVGATVATIGIVIKSHHAPAWKPDPALTP